MKKFSKILAIVLTLSLLAGVLAVTSFADEAQSSLDASQYGDSIQNLTYIDYDNQGVSSSASFGNASEGGSFSSNGKATLVTYTGEDGSTNKYVKLEKGPNPPTSGAYANTFHGFTIGKSTHTLGNYDYLVFSMDFMSDEVDESGKLMYLEKAYIGTYGQTLGYKSVYFVSDGNDWYLAPSADSIEGGVKLHSNAGEWNNYTLVLNRAGKNGGVYVNGQLALALSGITASMFADRIVVNLKGATPADFSICIDNGASNAYGTADAENPYSSGDKFGLDDYFAMGNVNLPISSCEDIVYNPGYTFPVSSAVAAESTIVSGDVVTDYQTPVGALVNAGNGDTVKLNKTTIFASAVKADKFTVLCENGAELIVTEDMRQLYSVTEASSENETLYSIKKKAENSEIKEFIINGNGAGAVGSYSNYVTFSASATEANGNKYWGYTSRENLTNTTEYTNSGRYFYNSATGNSVSDLPTSSDYKYSVIDFDVAAFGEVYLPDDATDGVYRAVTDISALSDSEKATVKLSYFEKSNIAILTGAWDLCVFFVSNGNQWYLSGDNTYDESDVALASGVGEWNHVTFISDLVNKKAYAYLNGEYVTAATMSQNTVQRITFFRLGEVKKPLAHNTDFKTGVDNITTYSYTKSYKSGEAVFGLDDYMALGNAELPISFVEDIYYGPNFLPSGVEYDSSAYLTKGESEYGFYNIGAALSAAENGDTLTVNGKLDLYTIDESIESLYINAESVELYGKVAMQYTYDAEAQLLTKRLLYTIIWQDIDGSVLLEEMLALDIAPDAALLDITSNVKGDYKKAEAWQYVIGEDGEYTSLVDFVSAYAGDVVTIVPATANVTWFAPDGKTVEAFEYWFSGSVASRDLSALNKTIAPLNNGWYELEYFWNSPDADMTVSTDEVCDFIPTLAPVSAVDIYFNYTLGAQFYPNYYIPTEIDGVVIDKVYTSYSMSVQNNKSEYYTNVVGPITDIFALGDWVGRTNTIEDVKDQGILADIGGASYYKYSTDPSLAFAWYNISAMQVEFTVTYNGAEYQIHSAPALTAIGAKTGAKSYANAILGTYDSPKACSDNTRLLANWIQYMSYSYATQGTNIMLGAAEDLLKNHVAHNPGCTCIKDISTMIPTEAPEGYTYGNFAEVESLSGMMAGFLVDKNSGRFGLYIPTDVVDEVGVENFEAYVEFVGIAYNAEKGTYQTGKKIKANLEKYYVKDETTSEPDDVKAYVVSGCYLFIMELDATRIYNVDRDMNITLKVNGEIVCQGTYCFDVYLYNINESIGLYVYDEESGKYVVDNEKLTYNESKDTYSYSVKQRSYQAALALRAFGMAAYEYMVAGTELAK